MGIYLGTYSNDGVFSISIPPVALDLLEKLMTLDPAKRITAAEAMDHDYFWRVQTCKPRE